MAWVALVALVGPDARAAGGAYRQGKHGNPTTGVLRLQSEPRGECVHCHQMHGSYQGNRTGPYPYLLFAPNDNSLCFSCHAIPAANLIYQGQLLYGQSAHATASSNVWPGPAPPARSSSDRGFCLTCHSPHGVRDASGVVPSLLHTREEALCTACHDGSPAARDVRTQFQKPYRHPIQYTGIHAESEGGDPASYAVSPTNRRHAECVDCHNPHYLRANVAAPTAPDASNRLLATGRVRVQNGAAGTVPLYTYVGPGDVAFAREYELCFKCHSSWTAQPPGQRNEAVLFNPANPSFHPVESAGRNANIPAGAFSNGWAWNRTVYCTDCHSSDDPGVRGPHGSTYRFILARSYTNSSTVPQSMASTDLCFACHQYDVYANPTSASATKALSRFNAPQQTQGHTFHVGTRQVACFSCHESHGSTLYPALMAVGRTPVGLTSYSQTTGGGTCWSTCHGSTSYTVNYAR